MSLYDARTFDSRNPVARFAHRSRLKRSLRLLDLVPDGKKVLDYGCGTGRFVAALNACGRLEAMGYEPFMEQTCAPGLPVFRSIEEVMARRPFDVITVFETVEHLDASELQAMLDHADALLTENGRILFSAPIELGPALILKDLNRFALRRRRSEHGLRELLAAAFLGKPATRAHNIKFSHRGFDFRETVRYLAATCGDVTDLAYGPLPIGTWYGNSQVFFWLTPHRNGSR